MRRPVVSCADPLWSANISATMQTCQNSALKTATGCLLMTSIEFFPRVSIIPLHQDVAERPYMIQREKSNNVRESRNQKAYQADLNSIHTDPFTDIVNHYSIYVIFGIHPYPLQLQTSDASVLLAQLRQSSKFVLDTN